MRNTVVASAVRVKKLTGLGHGQGFSCSSMDGTKKTTYLIIGPDNPTWYQLLKILQKNNIRRKEKRKEEDWMIVCMCVYVVCMYCCVCMRMYVLMCFVCVCVCDVMCCKSHACHAKAVAEQRRPRSAKAYIRPRASAPSPTPATQKQRQSGGAQNAPKRTSDPGQVLQVPRLPRKSSGRAAEPKTRQSVHQTPRKCSKPHACHAKAAAERRSPKRAKAYIRPRASAPSPTPATQKQRQSGGAQNAPKRTSDPAQVLQVPRLPRKSSGRAAEPKTRQSVHQTPGKCSKSHACHAKQRQSSGDQEAPKRTSDPVQVQQVPRLPRESSGRAAETKERQSVHQTPCRCSKSHACHAKAAAERRSPKRAKAYIRPRASAPSPTPATQKQRQSGGAQNAPKRTSDPAQVFQAPRLPRKSSGRAAEPKTRQSVHQTPRKCSKSHACHAKAAAERRSPKRAKAYIRPRASAPSPTPATQKQRQSGGAQNAPKRTSDPAQVLQVPRLPRKSSGRAAEPKTRQSVHQTPGKCSKSHACHAKAAAERRSPKRAKAYIRPRASAPSPTPATQKQRQSGRAQNAPKRTSDPGQVLQVPRLPRKSSGRAAEPKTRQSVHQTPAAEPKERQSVHQTPGKCAKSHACHAKAAAERRSPKRAKAYIRPRASAPSPTPTTQKQRQSGGAQGAPKRTSDPVQVRQAPRLPRKSSGRAAEPKTRQSVHQTTPCKCSKPHACHAKATAEQRSPKRAKAYIRPRASAPSPTPATQKQRQSGGAQNAPKRTSDPVQVLQVPRLPRKSSGRAAEPKTRQSVHQTPCKCSKSHACHAKAAEERRSPKRAKAYIRPRASAPSPTPATQKQRQSGGAQNAPKRTSDPGQVLQVPRLPRKSSGRAAEPKTRQSEHQTPCKCSKSHACHAKATAEQRSPKRAKAYIRPRASAPSPTPATQKQRQSGGAQNAPKRTSDPVQVLQVPRLPRKSSGRAAEPKTRQSVHQTPRKCSKPHACHAKATAEQRSPKRAKAYIRPRASAPSPTPATQKQRQSGGAQNAPKRTSDPVQVLQVPRLPRKSSGRAAEPKTRQSVHQTPCKCSKSHACHAKAAEERRSPKRAKAYIRPRASAPSPTPATQKQRQSGGAQNAPKRTSDPLEVPQVPHLPRKTQRQRRRQAVWCQAVWCQAVWCQAVWCRAAWCQPAWCQAARCQAVWCQAIWCVYVLLCVCVEHL